MTMTEKALRYLTGFGNEHASEALKGALPAGQNAPQKPPRGLYTEQISGTPFTTLRGQNRRSWLYRIRPSAIHPAFRRIERDAIIPRCPTGIPPLSCRGESDAPREGPVVRILFPPAVSQCLAGWFKRYRENEQPERFERSVQIWDTANEATELSDFSVCTTWGVKG